MDLEILMTIATGYEARLIGEREIKRTDIKMMIFYDFLQFELILFVIWLIMSK